MYGNRVSKEYIDGVSAFKRAAEQDMLTKGMKFMYCPCIDCDNLLMFDNSAQIESHLIRRGFKRGYLCWTSHDEKQIIQEDDNIIEEARRNRGEEDNHTHPWERTKGKGKITDRTGSNSTTQQRY